MTSALCTASKIWLHPVLCLQTGTSHEQANMLWSRCQMQARTDHISNLQGLGVHRTLHLPHLWPVAETCPVGCRGPPPSLSSSPPSPRHITSHTHSMQPHLWPVAESVAVLALPVTQVECHHTALVVDAQGGKGAPPHIHGILKGEVGVSSLGGVTCSQEGGRKGAQHGCH